MTKSYTDYQIESERLAEWMFQNKRHNIMDRDSFDLEYFKEKGITDFESKKQEKFLNQTFKEYVDLEKRRSTKRRTQKRRVFKEAGGKDLIKDRQTQHKKVYDHTQIRQYLKTGSKNADLKGLDTPPRKKRKTGTAMKHDFPLLGHLRGRTVQVREVTIMWMGKKVKRYVTRQGRYAKLL